MRSTPFLALALMTTLVACGGEAPAPDTTAADSAAAAEAAAAAAAAATPSIVTIATGSPDHTTLVAALQAADLVTTLSGEGPFTVFAPVNAAFEKLPAGTVENLLKPENKQALADILLHHVTAGSFDGSQFTDGQVVTMVGTKTVTVRKDATDLYVGGAKVVASVQASNGWVHVVDGVILP
jgi:uncharacterized surface protein with fasciclin (FAS1) repeats